MIYRPTALDTFTAPADHAIRPGERVRLVAPRALGVRGPLPRRFAYVRTVAEPHRYGLVYRASLAKE